MLFCTLLLCSHSFRVSPNGEIFVAGELDRETTRSYHLTLRASDVGGLTASTLLVIDVLDVNDVAPAFIPAVFTLILTENVVYPSALTVLVSVLIIQFVYLHVSKLDLNEGTLYI